VTTEELEKKVRVLEDLNEIMELQRRYMYYFDSLEFDKIGDCYAENAKMQIRNSPVVKGKKAIVEFYQTRGKGKKVPTDAHFVGQPLISVEGDKARGRWNVCILFAEPVRWVQGRNDVEYIKENGKWKFNSLKFTRIKAAPASMAP
jgi:hypothetical protein